MKIYNAGNRIMNTYIYPIPDGYVMIDTGYENSFQHVSASMKKLGISLNDIHYIFLTHAHDDHAGFLKEMLDKYPNVRCILSGKAFSTLARGQNSFEGGCSSRLAWLFCHIMKVFGKGEHRFPPLDSHYKDKLLKIDEDNLAMIETILGGKVLLTPGHTADSISLKIGDKIFCGDAAMNGFPSLRRITIWIEDKPAFEESWKVLRDEQAEFIYPAHGKPFRSDDLLKNKKHIPNMKLYALKK